VKRNKSIKKPLLISQQLHCLNLFLFPATLQKQPILSVIKEVAEIPFQYEKYQESQPLPQLKVFHPTPEYLYNFTRCLDLFYFHHNFITSGATQTHLSDININENFGFSLKQFTAHKTSLDSSTFMFFLNLKYSHFSTFFLNNQIDTPICFLKTISNKRNSAKLDLAKMANYMILSGKKEKTFKNFVKTLMLFYSTSITPFFANAQPFYLSTFYTSLPS
jgi:hypothetical protein